MKKNLLIVAAGLLAIGSVAQNAKYHFGITSGISIQHYNGNLGNSFFQFKTTCFAGESATLGMYMNRSFDVNLGFSVGDFGYCQTEKDKSRLVSVEQRCPGCTDRLGMGELRSRMTSVNANVKYKFANGYLLKEDAKLAPYAYAGLGINRLVDNMKKNCVNAGDHFSVNAGLGIKYNVTQRFNVGYNMGVNCFLTKKVYLTNSTAENEAMKDADDIKMERRKDLCLQNTLFVGVNF